MATDMDNHFTAERDQWPPQSAGQLKRWLERDLPHVRGRLDVIRNRVVVIRAAAYVPASARLSQIQVARTVTSDPTFATVETLHDAVPELVREYKRKRSILRQYQAAKRVLADDERRVIEGRYERQMSNDQVWEALFMPKSTYFVVRQAALRKMFRALSGKQNGGASA